MEPKAVVHEHRASNLWNDHRVDSHAPIGVMVDHTHDRGEFMLSYRYMFMHMDGHRAGTDKLSTSEVHDRGFGAAALEMDMEMHMLGAMYAPTDNLTLLVMTNYVLNDMTLERSPMMMGRHFGGRSLQVLRQ